MTQRTPTITVMMPVYNGASYVAEAVRSILDQSFRNFDFLIIDDGSSDRTEEIIRSFDDQRIRIIRNVRNQGIASVANAGIAHARGRYLARMDADDFSYPYRLERQLDYMQRHPEVAIAGTWSRTIGKVVRSWETCFPERHECIMAHMLFNTAISNPTAMLDLARLRTSGLRFDDSALHAEDYHFWTNVSHQFRLANVPEVLLDYRVHDRQVSVAHKAIQRQTADRIRQEFLAKLGLPFNKLDIEIHNKVANFEWNDSLSSSLARRWLRKLERNSRYLPSELRIAIDDEIRKWHNQLVAHFGEQHHGLHRLASNAWHKIHGHER